MRATKHLLAALLVVIIAFTPTWTYASQNVGVTINSGPLALTLTGASTLAAVTLTGYDQASAGALGTIDIRDARGMGAGWNLVLHADDFVNTDGSGVFIPAAGFEVAGTPIVTTVAGNTGPAAFSGALNNPLLLLSADAHSGMGRYQTNPALSLVVPADTIAGAYETTVTMTITSGP